MAPMMSHRSTTAVVTFIVTSKDYVRWPRRPTGVGGRRLRPAITRSSSWTPALIPKFSSNRALVPTNQWRGGSALDAGPVRRRAVLRSQEDAFGDVPFDGLTPVEQGERLVGGP